MVSDICKIKKDMMELWKDTFHDSSRYINLVFDTYFYTENVFYCYDGDKLIAALLGVEYEFGMLDNSGKPIRVKGLYLCGLATHPEYRRKGIMATLMEMAENSAKRRGLDFTFLIPADSHLREYYKKKGYSTASFKRKENVKIEKKGDTHKMYIYTFKDFFERRNYEFLNSIADWCRSREVLSKNYVRILHSQSDFIAAMSENENSFFLTDCSFDPKYPILAKIKAVVFPTLSQSKNDVWKFLEIYLEDIDDRLSSSSAEIQLPGDIQDALFQIYPNCELELNLPFTGDVKENREKVEPYAMVKLLNTTTKIENFQNQIFYISLMLD